MVQKFRRQIGAGAMSFHFARDGVEALAALKANGCIDLVVTDINMPRMDGLLLLEKLQEGEERVSTIIVSAYGDMANIRTAMNRGAFDFVTKPIDFSDLEATISKTLRHIEVLREARQRQAAAEQGPIQIFSTKYRPGSPVFPSIPRPKSPTSLGSISIGRRRRTGCTLCLRRSWSVSGRFPKKSSTNFAAS